LVDIAAFGPIDAACPISLMPSVLSVSLSPLLAPLRSAPIDRSIGLSLDRSPFAAIGAPVSLSVRFSPYRRAFPPIDAALAPIGAYCPPSVRLSPHGRVFPAVGAA
jgi:hypothetical protein